MLQKPNPIFSLLNPIYPSPPSSHEDELGSHRWREATFANVPYWSDIRRSGEKCPVLRWMRMSEVNSILEVRLVHKYSREYWTGYMPATAGEGRKFNVFVRDDLSTCVEWRALQILVAVPIVLFLFQDLNSTSFHKGLISTVVGNFGFHQFLARLLQGQKYPNLAITKQGPALSSMRSQKGGSPGELLFIGVWERPFPTGTSLGVICICVCWIGRICPRI